MNGVFRCRCAYSQWCSSIMGCVLCILMISLKFVVFFHSKIHFFSLAVRVWINLLEV